MKEGKPKKIAPVNEAEIEAFLKAQPHAFSRYDLHGKYIPHPINKDDLLELISQRETYVVDNNSNWKSECKNHLDKAFVIPPTLSREDGNTIALIVNEGRCKLGNIFLIGFHPEFRFILVDRMDVPYADTFNLEKLKAQSKIDGQTEEEKRMQLASNSRQKKTIRGILGDFLQFGNITITEFLKSGQASDLPPPKDVQHIVTALGSEIDRRVPHCKHKLDESMRVSELCYANLLLNKRKMRTEFDKPNYKNVFGDMNVLSMAIYLQCNILTNDKPLKKMAHYAGIKSFETVPK